MPTTCQIAACSTTCARVCLVLWPTPGVEAGDTCAPRANNSDPSPPLSLQSTREIEQTREPRRPRSSDIACIRSIHNGREWNMRSFGEDPAIRIQGIPHTAGDRGLDTCRLGVLVNESGVFAQSPDQPVAQVAPRRFRSVTCPQSAESLYSPRLELGAEFHPASLAQCAGTGFLRGDECMRESQFQPSGFVGRLRTKEE